MFAPGRPSRSAALLLPAVVATLVTTGLVVADIDTRSSEAAAIDLIQADLDGPPVQALREDFGGIETIDVGAVEHDGQLFYAVARQPMHLADAAADLDRPRYRLQRPLYPWLAWLLHPTGGGPGLVFAMFAVGVAALLVGGVAMGSISAQLGGPRWLGAVYPLLPGSFLSLRLSTADSLAVALLLVAIAASLNRRTATAALAGTAAVLAKEAVLLGLVGLALHHARRRRWLDAVTLAGIPLLALLLWGLVVRAAVDGADADLREIVMPISGIASAWRHFWSQGTQQLGLVALLVATLAGAAGLAIGRLRHPLSPALALNLALMVCLSISAIGLSRNAGRTSLATVALGLLVVATPRAVRSTALEEQHPHRDADEGETAVAARPVALN